MYRYVIRVACVVELEAESKSDAYDIARQWADAVEEGDGHRLQDWASCEVTRCTILLAPDAIHQLSLPPVTLDDPDLEPV
jgi:hypothetical protein